MPAENAMAVSAKTGLGIEDVLEAVVTDLPAPTGAEASPLQALLVDSWYDAYLGVMTLIRVRDGIMRAGEDPHDGQAAVKHTVERVGVFGPKPMAVEQLGPGEIGFINAGKDCIRCKGW